MFFLHCKLLNKRKQFILQYIIKQDVFFFYFLKENFKSSITFLKQKLQASEFIVYEDNADLFKNENATIADIIKDKNFNIFGYLIK